MTDTLHILNDLDSVTVHAQQCQFKTDITLGLSKLHKEIHSKYFYDKIGCELYNKISSHPDYYLTACEVEILNNCKKQLSKILDGKPFNLIEFGPGEGIKTQILIEQFLRDSISFTYTPIDISATYLKKLVSQLKQSLPTLKLTAIKSDYFKGLEWLSSISNRRNLVLFLGSSIGNLDFAATEEFLHHLWKTLHHGDYVFIGFDLRKDVEMLMRAYNDSDGITRDFNLNLLKRINHELAGNFNIEKFRHYATYNVSLGAMESYLISTIDQRVDIEAIRKVFGFYAGEAIHVEYSYKYLIPQIEKFANDAGFEIISHFTDSHKFFIDSLWQVRK